MHFWFPNGSQQVDMRFAYSIGTDVHLELVQAVTGTVWEAPVSGGAGVFSAHHVGVWCDDVPGEFARLAASGAPLISTAFAGQEVGTASGFAYHGLEGSLVGGLVVELVESSRRARFEEWFRGGPFPPPAQV